MPIELRCSRCDKLLRVPDESRGKTARCPQCGGLTSVPAAKEGTSAASAPNPFADASPASAGAVPRLGDPTNPYAKAVSPDQPAYQWKTVGPGDLVHSRIDLGELFSHSWKIFTGQVGMGVLFTLICFGIGMATQIVGFPLSMAQQAAGNDLGMRVGLFMAQQVWGLVVNAGFVCLLINFGVQVARGNPSPLGKVFDIGHCYLKVLGLLVLIQLINFAIGIVCAIPGGALFLVPDNTIQMVALALFVVAMIVAVIAMMVIYMIFFLSSYLIVDRRMGVIESMIASKQFMRGNKLVVFAGFLLVSIGGSLFSLVTCCVGYLFFVPYIAVWGSVVYLMATGQPMAGGSTPGDTLPGAAWRSTEYPIVAPGEPMKWSAGDR